MVPSGIVFCAILASTARHLTIPDITRLFTIRAETAWFYFYGLSFGIFCVPVSMIALKLDQVRPTDTVSTGLAGYFVDFTVFYMSPV